MCNSRTALGAKTALAWSHSEANLTAHVIELAAGKNVHCAFEHFTGDQFAFADDLLAGGRLAVVFNIVEAVTDVVVGVSFCLRNNFVGSAAGPLLPHLLTHDVDDAFCHEAVGRELTAGNGQDTINAIATQVIDDVHSSGHVTGI